MKFSDVVTKDDFFKPEDLKQLEEAVLNPQWSEPMDPEDFLAELREMAESKGVKFPDED